MTDGELLAQYARNHSETAFEELVRRHVDLVYSAALRQMDGDAHRAEDVTQLVFLDLARKAPALAKHSSLTGWLYTSTRFVAANVRRSEHRRGAREQEAHAMTTILQSSEPEPDWAELGPLLDDVMHTLDEPDREAVLLRHFERRTFSEIGSKLGLTEGAARMRVDRALDKLQRALAKRGLTSATLALAALLTTNAVSAAPVPLAAAVARAAIANAGTAGGWSLALAGAKATLAIAAAAAAVVLALAFHFTCPEPKPAVTATSPNSPAQNFSVVAPAQTNSAPRPTAASKHDRVLHLKIVAADTGEPIPFVPLAYEWETTFRVEPSLVTDRFGICDVPYTSTERDFGLRTQVDGFADTRLLWRMYRGEVVPTNYVLRLDRATPIGGRVVDPDGKPVAGAGIQWHPVDEAPAVIEVPQTHRFLSIQTTTDDEGRWRLNRIAEEMIRKLQGYARHTNYLDPYRVLISGDPRAERELRNGTHVYRMGRAATVTGTVVDFTGAPVSDAKVLIGRKNYGGSREAETIADGTFTITGCEPGRQWVSAEARGYATTTVPAELAAGAPPIRLVLERGKTLRLRTVDRAGNPVPKTRVYLINANRLPGDADATAVQTSFWVESDGGGRVIWTNAPEGELRFGFNAPGFVELENVVIPADGVEHPVALAPSVVIHGSVRDQSTGEAIPRFRIALGYPDLFHGITNAAWAQFDRFWPEFTNGTYRYTCDEPLVRGTENRGYIFKFEAQRYASWISRIVTPEEGDVKLDVALRPAADTTVTVFQPDGRPAVNADVGLIFPGSPLWLVPGGLSRNIGPGGALMATDRNGTFALRPDESVGRVVVLGPDGFAEAAPAALAANPVMQLQPWGRLEVMGMAAGDGTNRLYQFEFSGGELFQKNRCSTFETQGGPVEPGRRLFSKLPPGRHQLVWLRALPKEGRRPDWEPEGKTPFEIRAGETTRLDLQ